MQAPDFSNLFGSDVFADVEVLLREEQEDGGSGQELPLLCHAVVLTAFSPYFKAKLWNRDAAADTRPARHSAGQDNKAWQHRIVLPVPSGQLAVGQLLVRSMYAAAPNLSGIRQRQLTQLLLLSDRYEVAKVAAAASTALKAIPVRDFAWDTLTAVYSLPPGLLPELPARRGLFAAAAAKLQHELGDLELVWADTSKQKQLLQLPFTALQQLLANANTRVASECTVLYTIERWYKTQQQRPHLPPEQQPSDKQLRELVGLVRMQHCGKSYVTTVFADGEVAERALTRLELAAACAVAGAGSSSSSYLLKAAKWGWPVFEQFPAWTQEHRPATARAAALDWKIPAVRLSAAYDACAAGAQRLYSPRTVFGGVQYQLFLEVTGKAAAAAAPSCGAGGSSSSSSAGPSMQVTIYVQAPNLPRTAVCLLDREVLTCSDADGQQYVQYSRDVEPTLTCTTQHAGASFDLGAVGSYSKFVAALHERHLALDDGSMQVQLRIHGVH